MLWGPTMASEAGRHLGRRAVALRNGEPRGGGRRAGKCPGKHSLFPYTVSKWRKALYLSCDLGNEKKETPRPPSRMASPVPCIFEAGPTGAADGYTPPPPRGGIEGQVNRCFETAEMGVLCTETGGQETLWQGMSPTPHPCPGGTHLHAPQRRVLHLGKRERKPIASVRAWNPNQEETCRRGRSLGLGFREPGAPFLPLHLQGLRLLARFSAHLSPDHLALK